MTSRWARRPTAGGVQPRRDNPAYVTTETGIYEIFVTATSEVVRVHPRLARPTARRVIAVSPDGATLGRHQPGRGHVLAINAATGRVAATAAGPGRALRGRGDANGATLYVADMNSDSVAVLGGDPQTTGTVNVGRLPSRSRSAPTARRSGSATASAATSPSSPRPHNSVVATLAQGAGTANNDAAITDVAWRPPRSTAGGPPVHPGTAGPRCPWPAAARRLSCWLSDRRLWR